MYDRNTYTSNTVKYALLSWKLDASQLCSGGTALVE